MAACLYALQVLYDDDIHALTCSRDKSFLCWDLRVSGV